jgi:hypothetical protein
MDASAYAFTHGVRRTRITLRDWQHERWRIMRRWTAGSALAAFGLLAAVLTVSALSSAGAEAIPRKPPFTVGNRAHVPGILGHNLLVLALHAMACVAGFVAGSSLPLQQHRKTKPLSRPARNRRRLAIVLHTSISSSRPTHLRPPGNATPLRRMHARLSPHVGARPERGLRAASLWPINLS